MTTAGENIEGHRTDRAALRPLPLTSEAIPQPFQHHGSSLFEKTGPVTGSPNCILVCVGQGALRNVPKVAVLRCQVAEA